MAGSSRLRMCFSRSNEFEMLTSSFLTVVARDATVNLICDSTRARLSCVECTDLRHCACQLTVYWLPLQQSGVKPLPPAQRTLYIDNSMRWQSAHIFDTLSVATCRYRFYLYVVGCSLLVWSTGLKRLCYQTETARTVLCIIIVDSRQD